MDASQLPQAASLAAAAAVAVAVAVVAASAAAGGGCPVRPKRVRQLLLRVTSKLISGLASYVVCFTLYMENTGTCCCCYARLVRQLLLLCRVN